MKVYLSKSNLSDPYLVDRVRDTLINGGHTVYEHHGGIYDPEHMLECKAVIMVPNKDAISVASRTLNTKHLRGIYGVHLGKGQMTQFLDFRKHIQTNYPNKKNIPVFFVEEVGDFNIYTSCYHNYELENNPDWKVRFGLVYLVGDCDNMLMTLKTAETAWEIAYPKVTNLVKVPVYDSSSGYTKIVNQKDAVVSFKDTSGETYFLQESGGYKSKNIPEMEALTLSHCLANFHFRITSVRRFSDGRIFKIGDNTDKGVISDFVRNESIIKARILFDTYKLADLQHFADGITVPPFHTYDPKRGVYPTPGHEKERETLAKNKIAGADAMVDKADYVLKIEKSQPIHLACRRLFNR